jgi:hypothetical protein
VSRYLRGRRREEIHEMRRVREEKRGADKAKRERREMDL